MPSQELSCYDYKRHHDLTLSESDSSDLAGIVEPLNPAYGHILVPHKNHTNIMERDKVTKEMIPSNIAEIMKCENGRNQQNFQDERPV